MTELSAAEMYRIFEEAREQRERAERAERVLLMFVHAYANTERLDHEYIEAALFEAWLKACAALGI